MDRQIERHRQQDFAIAILDVNDLKKVNDTAGHQAGDQYLCSDCKIICNVFKRSPVFRVGGDEFEHVDELMKKMCAQNAKAVRDGGIVIACGMAKYENDSCVATVFERADQNMYENKNSLKGAAQS